MPMRRAVDIAPAGAWPETRAVATVTLDLDHRHRRRIALACDDGGDVLLDLAEARMMRNGDGLRLADGDWIGVRAAEEDLAEIRCRTPEDLARVAWHLGNRHLPVQIARDALRIRYDHVIVEMARGLGATVTRFRAAFEPEGGAYAHHRHEDARDAG